MAITEHGIYFLTTADEVAKHHLSVREAACPCCRVIKLGMPIITIWEAMRTAVGSNVVNCGYRCGAHQKYLDGTGLYYASSLGDMAPHPSGLAMDPTIPDGWTYEAWATLAETKAHELGIPIRIGWREYANRGDGIIHIDTLPLLARVDPQYAAIDAYRMEVRW